MKVQAPSIGVVAGICLGVLSGCAGIQSALEPTGEEATELKILLWVVTAIAALITIGVMALAAVALWGPARWRSGIAQVRTIVAGGIAFPITVLTGLLVVGLLLLEAGQARTDRAEGPGIDVVGKQWWWKVVYTDSRGQTVVSANELRLPVGVATEVRLTSEDVIHSFWAPQLGGKLDMIPGKTNVFSLQPTIAAVSRGQCAEYCGGAHALMAFYVITMPPEDYAAWLARESAPAPAPSGEKLRKGQSLFMQNGCGGCHAIRGTTANGTIGPDLTHVGSRMSLGAATLPNDRAAFARWISANQHIKPQNLMPPFGHLTDEQLDAIAAYLDSLE